VIPSIGGNLDQLLANANHTLEVISELPLEQVFDSAHIALDAVAATLTEFGEIVAEIERILADPASKELIVTLNETLESFQHVASDFSEGSATNRDLQQTLQSLERTLEEMEPVLRNLRSKPNSLIFGGSGKEDMEPTGVQE
jgi:paraquat-inducible protein B